MKMYGSKKKARGVIATGSGKKSAQGVVKTEFAPNERRNLDRGSAKKIR